MSHYYSDPSREDETYALSDVETFQGALGDCPQCGETCYIPDGDSPTCERHGWFHRDEAENVRGGWFFWFCFPGCLPEGEPIGPYDTEDEAVDAARES